MVLVALLSTLSFPPLQKEIAGGNIESSESESEGEEGEEGGEGEQGNERSDKQSVPPQESLLAQVVLYM